MVSINSIFRPVSARGRAHLLHDAIRQLIERVFPNLALLVPPFTEWSLRASFRPLIVKLHESYDRGRPRHLLCPREEDGYDEIPAFFLDIKLRKEREQRMSEQKGLLALCLLTPRLTFKFLYSLMLVDKCFIKVVDDRREVSRSRIQCKEVVVIFTEYWLKIPKVCLSMKMN